MRKLTKREEISRLRGAISWLEHPFVDANTPEVELRHRIRLMLEDVARIDAGRAALGGKP